MSHTDEWRESRRLGGGAVGNGRGVRFDGFGIPLVIVVLLGAAQFLHQGIEALASTGDEQADVVGGVGEAGRDLRRGAGQAGEGGSAASAGRAGSAASAGGKRAGVMEDPVVPVCPPEGAGRARLYFSPARPVAGGPLRVVAVTEEELEVAAIQLETVAGRTDVEPLSMWGGPPWSWSVTMESAPPGIQRFVVASGDPAHPLACGSVEVGVRGAGEAERAGKSVWPVERAWDGEMEDLYAAWVGRLFRVDPGARAGWRPLHTVLRDPKRNFLWGHLGLGEDDPASGDVVVVEPDCGDTPFFLRAYFAWKLRLPFAVRHCPRGTRERGTRCYGDPQTNLTEEWGDVESPVARFNKWLVEDIADTVHSTTGRVLPEVDPSELVPVALSRETLRPGTVFVDTNGHVLVVSQWVPGTAERIGLLLAIDAHPDLTVSHKRFARASFQFDEALRTGGFKAFRPVVYEQGRIRFLSNAELAADPKLPHVSLEQYELPSTHAFYRKIDVLLNPEPLDPVAAYRSHMEGVLELLDERRAAVEVAVEYQKEHGWAAIEMPEGGAIFETTGPWEDYSTPARDLRLLIALDELIGFPQYVMDNPAIFRIPEGTSPGALMRSMTEEWRRLSGELGIEYTRSDGSTWHLSLADVVERLERFEQSYNPNECPEVRWGAGRKTDEMGPCERHAPADQVRRMEKIRWWHHMRFRPSRY
ncbi:MAG: hypothetical protein HY907_01295 [Deltaproteobacteria bacterium]|nr:hypothetical protein [Deltaproteobacteria bacterium]